MKFKVYYKEKLYFVLLTLISLAFYGISIYAMTMLSKKPHDLMLWVGVIVSLKTFFSVIFMSYLKGNGVKVHERQFSLIFDIVKDQAKQLGLSKIPDVYILQGNGVLNAFATKFAGRNFVVLHSDVVEIAYQDGIDTLAFVIGHEMGHIYRNHTGFLKSLLITPASFIPFLGLAYSRACEYTCDNIGYSLSPKAAAQGIMLLATGKQLYKKVDISQAVFTADTESRMLLSFGEILSTHPALVKRLFNVYEQDNDNFATDSTVFVSPVVDIKKPEIEL